NRHGIPLEGGIDPLLQVAAQPFVQRFVHEQPREESHHEEDRDRGADPLERAQPRTSAARPIAPLREPAGPVLVKRAACQARIVGPFTNEDTACRGHWRRTVRRTRCVIYVCFLQTPSVSWSLRAPTARPRARTYDRGTRLLDDLVHPSLLPDPRIPPAQPRTE